MNKNELLEICKSEENMYFRGWDFSYLEKRWNFEELPWDYKEIVLEYLKPNQKLLDMGTGGGEFLLSLNHPYNLTSVTEAWGPNVALCREELEPLGICVKQIFEDSEIPYDDNSFDIVINRHEAYDVAEVKRILKPNGIFISQQVGFKNNIKLSEMLNSNFKSQFPKLDLAHELIKWDNSNFDVLLADEYYPYVHFYDIGAIVYYAKIIEWEFPDFSVDKCINQLYKIQEEIERNGYAESLGHRFILTLRNKK